MEFANFMLWLEPNFGYVLLGLGAVVAAVTVAGGWALDRKQEIS